MVRALAYIVDLKLAARAGCWLRAKLGAGKHATRPQDLGDPAVRECKYAMPVAINMLNVCVLHAIVLIYKNIGLCVPGLVVGSGLTPGRPHMSPCMGMTCAHGAFQ